MSENVLEQGMVKISQQEAQRAAILLNTSIKSVAFYPQAHQAVRQPLEELASLLTAMLEQKPETYFGVVEGVFFLEEHIFVTPTLVRIAPQPEVRIIGNLSDRLKVLAALDLED